MNADIITSTTHPHGSKYGYIGGCRGGNCPAPVACRDVHRRYIGDFAFRRMYDSGMSPAQILEHEEQEALAAKQAARDAARAARTKPKPTPKPRPARRPGRRISRIPGAPATHLQATIAKLHSEGLSDKQIGEQLGKTREQIRGIRRYMGLPVNVPKTTLERVVELHAMGMNDEQIAKELKRELGYVGAVRRRAGLPFIPYQKTKVDHDTVRRLHAAGATDQEIADSLGVPRVIAQRRRAYLNLTNNQPPATSGVSPFQETT
jgi:DNA-binding CsgD family transcriptional regulator